MTTMVTKPVNILLIEDNPGDIELIKSAFEEAQVNTEIQVISDGQLALEYLQTMLTLPDIILLDINLPKVSGFEILKTIKNDPKIRKTPVVMLTSSEDEADINKSYDEFANSYISKPVDFDSFLDAIQSMEHFWLKVVKLPQHD